MTPYRHDGSLDSTARGEYAGLYGFPQYGVALSYDAKSPITRRTMMTPWIPKLLAQLAARIASLVLLIAGQAAAQSFSIRVQNEGGRPTI